MGACGGARREPHSLRGGGEEDDRPLRVRSAHACSTIDELRAAVGQRGGYGKVTGGSFLCPDSDPLVLAGGGTTLVGSDGVQVTGPVSMPGEEGGPGAGHVSGLLFRRMHADPRFARDEEMACMDAQGGGAWLLDDCEVRSEGGVGLRASGGAKLDMTGCRLGGLGEGAARAGIGAKAMDCAQATMTECTVSECLVGLIACGHARLVASGSGVRGVSYALMLDDRASVRVERCTVTDAIQGVVMAGDAAQLGASLEMTGNGMFSMLLCNYIVPHDLDTIYPTPSTLHPTS